MILLDISLPSHAPDLGGFLGHRIAIGSMFELHILISGLVSGATQLGPITEWMGWMRRRRDYDRLAHGMAKFLIYYFAFGAFTAILLVSVLLVVLWGRLWTTITTITFWPFMVESFSFVMMVTLTYAWYYTWRELERFKVLHITLGALLIVASFIQVLMIDLVASYMLTPALPSNPVSVFLNPTEVPLQVHRIVANLAYVGYAIAAICAFFLWRTRNLEDRGFYDWGVSFGLIWGTAMSLLQPVVGYSYAKEIQLHAYGSWYKMMQGDLSPAFLLQIFVLGLIYLVPQLYFQRRLAQAGWRGRWVMRTLSLLLFLCLLFATLPHHLALTYDQVQAEGLNRPFWQGGLINPLGAMIPYKIAALTGYVVFSLTGLYAYLKGLPRIRWGQQTGRAFNATLPVLSLVLVMLMIVLMGFIRENSRFPDGIAGQVQLHGQQPASPQSITDLGGVP